MRYVLFVIATLVSVCSCVPRMNFAAYYNSECVPEDTYEQIEPGIVTIVTTVRDMEASIKAHLSDGFVILGTMQFNAAGVSNIDVADFGAEKGATIILHSMTQTSLETASYVVPYTTTNKVIYHEGTVSNLGVNGDSYRYSGSSTESTTEWKRYSYQYGIYNHYYVFLAKKR